MQLPAWSWVCGALLVAVGLMCLVVVFYWDTLGKVHCDRETMSTTARNIGILFFGVVAIGFAIWRGIAADRQAKASLFRAETSERGLLNERYQKGAEMLGSSVPSVRLGGVFALQSLADEEPHLYHLQIMRLLAAFVCQPPRDADHFGHVGIEGS